MAATPFPLGTLKVDASRRGRSLVLPIWLTAAAAAMFVACSDKEETPPPSDAAVEETSDAFVVRNFRNGERNRT